MWECCNDKSTFCHCCRFVKHRCKTFELCVLGKERKHDNINKSFWNPMEVTTKPTLEECLGTRVLAEIVIFQPLLPLGPSPPHPFLWLYCPIDYFVLWKENYKGPSFNAIPSLGTGSLKSVSENSKIKKKKNGHDLNPVSTPFFSDDPSLPRTSQCDCKNFWLSFFACLSPSPLPSLSQTGHFGHVAQSSFVGILI